MKQTVYTEVAPVQDQRLEWLCSALPQVFRRVMGRDSLDAPLLQLPVAQMRLAQALYGPGSGPPADVPGETMGHLAERLGAGLSALTQASTRLVRNGLAERLADPTDRRVVRLRLTEKGRAWVSARRAQRRERLCRLWAELDPDERDELLTGVRALDRATRRLELHTASGETRRAHNGSH